MCLHRTTSGRKSAMHKSRKLHNPRPWIASMWQQTGFCLLCDRFWMWLFMRNIIALLLKSNRAYQFDVCCDWDGSVKFGWNSDEIASYRMTACVRRSASLHFILLIKVVGIWKLPRVRNNASHVPTTHSLPSTTQSIHKHWLFPMKWYGMLWHRTSVSSFNLK